MEYETTGRGNGKASTMKLFVEMAEENEKLKKENERLTTGIDILISKIKDHSNTEKVSTAKLIKGKHAYYRAISVTKVIRFINELKTEAAE